MLFTSGWSTERSKLNTRDHFLETFQERRRKKGVEDLIDAGVAVGKNMGTNLK